jgi:hypothetical protein
VFVRSDRVAIAPSYPFLSNVTRLLKLNENSYDGSLCNPDGNRDVPYPRLRVSRETDYDVAMIAEKGPPGIRRFSSSSCGLSV